MTSATLLKALSLILKVVSVVVKAFKSKLERELRSYAILKRFNLVSLEDDFDAIYVATLYNLIHDKDKPREIVSLFELDEVKESYKREIYEKNDWTFHIEIDDNLHTNPNLEELKNIQINIGQEIEDFKKEFREVTNQSRSPKEVESINSSEEINNKLSALLEMNKGSQISNIKAKHNPDIEITNQVIFSDLDVPPYVENQSRRSKVVQEFIDILQKNTWLAIHGSISMGKTQLAALIYEEIGGSVIWINLRELGSDNFFLKIVYDLASILEIPASSNVNKWVYDAVEKIPKNSIIIIDDLPKLLPRSTATGFYMSFIKQCSTKKIKILTTSNYEIPEKVKRSLLNFAKLVCKAVPPLLEEETKEIFESYSAPSNIISEYNRFVHRLSFGHPSIVNAIFRFLRENDWNINEDELSQLFSENYSVELNQDTQEVLVSTVDENTRELLYRLSFIIGSFSDEEVNVIRDVNPTIDRAWEKFNSALGLWVQKTTSNRYQLSPLIKRLKGHNTSKSLEHQLYLALGNGILDKRNFNLLEANNAIFYFKLANRFNDAGFVLTIALDAIREQSSLFFEWGFDLFWYHSVLPDEMDTKLKISIRAAQIKIGIDHQKNTSFLLSDLEKIVVDGAKKGIDIGIPALLLAIKYSDNNIKKSSYFFSLGLKHLDQIQDDDSLKELFSDISSSETIIWIIASEIRNRNDIENWISMVDNLSPQQRENSLQSEAIDVSCARIYYSVIREEEKKEQNHQDWEGIVDTFVFLCEKALTYNFELLAANALRGAINVLSERLYNIARSQKLTERYLAKLSDDVKVQFIVNDEIGKQLFHQGKKEDALKYIAEALEKEVSEVYVEKLDTFLIGSRLLGEEDKNVAHFYSERAYNFAKENLYIDELFKAKVIAEFAVSFWLNNDIAQALYFLEEGYYILMQSYVSSINFNGTIIRFGHVINYFHSLITTGNPPETDINGEPYAPPSRGCFLGNNEGLIKSGYYFEERKFINALYFLRLFEWFDDYKYSRKWAYICLQESNKLDFNAFISVSHATVVYLILDMKYDDAIDQTIKLVETNNRFIDNGQSVESLVESEKVAEIIADRPKVRMELDDIVAALALEPIIIHFLYKILRNEDQSDNILDEFKLFLQRWEGTLSKINRSEILYFIETVLAESETTANLVNRANSYSGELPDTIKSMAYIIISMQAQPTEALRLQLSVIPSRLEPAMKRISTGSYNFLLVPFFENFWIMNYEKRHDEFSNHEFWRSKSWPMYEKSDQQNKLKILFKILCHHLNHEPNDHQYEWMNN
ncbi:MAG: hypothetical protein RIG62_29845 [Cyclobacteriaceae bacterium]